MLYTNLLNTKLTQINDLFVGIEFVNGLNPFGKTILEKPENMNDLIKRISILYGQEIKLKLIDLTKKESIEEVSALENFAKDKNIDINIIEE